jgi:hypothetical protein
MNPFFPHTEDRERERERERRRRLAIIIGEGEDNGKISLKTKFERDEQG